MDANGQPMTDDAELAKVLEGMQDATATVTTPPEPQAGLSFEATPPAASDPAAPTVPMPQTPAPADALPPVTAPVTNTISPITVSASGYVPGNDPALETIKKDALEQLRPLVDKLDLEPDEKFDTLLLIIRSTDDKSLVSQAYESAKLIADEAKRAEAMLDIIKEIDYFNNPAAGQPQL